MDKYTINAAGGRFYKYISNNITFFRYDIRTG